MTYRNPHNDTWKNTLRANRVPDSVISEMSGIDAENDFYILMGYFCNSWPGRSGQLDGCRVYVHPDNIDALNVFRICSPGAKQADIESAIRMAGISDVPDCWARVNMMNYEFLKTKSTMPKNERSAR